MESVAYRHQIAGRGCVFFLTAFSVLWLFGAARLAAEEAATNRLVLEPIIQGNSYFSGRIELANAASETNIFVLQVWPADVLKLDTNVAIPKGQKWQYFSGESKSRRYREATVVARNESGTIRLEAKVTVIPKRPSTLALIVVGGGSVLLLLGVIPFCCWSKGYVFLILGEDGLASTSKCQAFLWTVMVFFAYPSIALVKWLETGDYAMSIPKGLAVAMGLSFGTAIGAKAITQNQVDKGIIEKRDTAPVPQGRLAALSGLTSKLRYLFMTDAGKMDLGKIQLMSWTFIGLAIFLAEWLRIITLPDAKDMRMPTVDDAMWVLMGLGSGVYLGSKLVRGEGFEILNLNPQTATAASLATNGVVAVVGFTLSQNAKVTVIVDGNPEPTWSGTRQDEHSLTIKAPAGQTPRTTAVALEIDGVMSANSVNLKVT